MPKYVLHYFNVGSRGEASRIIFKLAGVDFEDRRIAFSEWPERKESKSLICTKSYSVFLLLYTERGWRGLKLFNIMIMNPFLCNTLNALDSPPPLSSILSKGEKTLNVKFEKYIYKPPKVV